MINNPYDLSDEEIWGKEPTWEEREIEKLKKKIEQLEDQLEDAECTIEQATKYIKEHVVFLDYYFINKRKVPKLELIDGELMELILILFNKRNANDSNV